MITSNYSEKQFKKRQWIKPGIQIVKPVGNPTSKHAPSLVFSHVLQFVFVLIDTLYKLFSVP